MRCISSGSHDRKAFLQSNVQTTGAWAQRLSQTHRITSLPALPCILSKIDSHLATKTTLIFSVFGQRACACQRKRRNILKQGLVTPQSLSLHFSTLSRFGACTHTHLAYFSKSPRLGSKLWPTMWGMALCVQSSPTEPIGWPWHRCHCGVGHTYLKHTRGGVLVSWRFLDRKIRAQAVFVNVDKGSPFLQAFRFGRR